MARQGLLRSATLPRSRFIRGDLRPERAPIRPPWAIPEADFVDVCTRCDQCIVHCPTQLLVRGSGGFPKVDFGRGECTFCGECVAACREGALRRAADSSPWSLSVRISAACLAHGRVVCRSCGEMCEARAIRFRPRLGAASLPEIDMSGCTGCGACVRMCPAGAINIVQSDEVRHAHV